MEGPLRYTFAGIAVVGLMILTWACIVNPRGAELSPDDPPPPLVTSGPYRFLTHPMYVGEWLLISGLAGVAAGFWNFLAVGLALELMLREWARREWR